MFAAQRFGLIETAGAQFRQGARKRDPSAMCRLSHGFSGGRHGDAA
jgi:hypothetical protein